MKKPLSSKSSASAHKSKDKSARTVGSTVSVSISDTSKLASKVDAGNRGQSSVAHQARFLSSLLTLATFGLTSIVFNMLTISFTTFGGWSSLALATAAVHWYALQGNGLSRRRRAYLNEKNFLETYKRLDRSMGHLFQKEPDTPGGVGGCCQVPPSMLQPSKDGPPDLAALPLHAMSPFQKSVMDHYAEEVPTVNQYQNEASKLKIDAQHEMVPLPDIPLPGQKPRQNFGPEGDNPHGDNTPAKDPSSDNKNI
ncbi:hypothetical protein AAVH_03410 [Aphelenchoides avenae]|nr:hypothetical protein AAVH_03410 [Aphelenchus avenae]